MSPPPPRGPGQPTGTHGGIGRPARSPRRAGAGSLLQAARLPLAAGTDCRLPSWLPPSRPGALLRLILGEINWQRKSGGGNSQLQLCAAATMAGDIFNSYCGMSGTFLPWGGGHQRSQEAAGMVALETANKHRTFSSQSLQASSLLSHPLTSQTFLAAVQFPPTELTLSLSLSPCFQPSAHLADAHVL